MGESTSAAQLLPAGPPTVPRGDLPAFPVVYQRFFDLVWSSVRQLGIGPDAVDDVVQEVFVVIHARLPSLEHVESLRSWVYSVTRRTVSTFRRAQRTRTASGAQYAEVAQWLEPLPPTPLELTERAARQRLLVQLLGELDEQKREVFSLAELEGFTAPEIAEALDVPVNTVYSRLRAARQAFEVAVARHLARQKGAAT